MSTSADDLTSSCSSLSSEDSQKGIFEQDSGNVKGEVKKLKIMIIFLSIVSSIFILVAIFLAIVIFYSRTNDETGIESIRDHEEYKYRFYRHNNDGNEPSLQQGIVGSPKRIESPVSIYNEDLTQVMLIAGEGNSNLPVFECLVDVYCCPSNLTNRIDFAGCRKHQRRTYYWASQHISLVKNELLDDMMSRRLDLEAEVVCPADNDMFFDFVTAEESPIEELFFECYGECEASDLPYFESRNINLLSGMSESFVQRIHREYSSECRDYSTTAIIVDDDGMTKSSEDARWKMKDMLYFFCSHVLRVQVDEDEDSDEGKLSHFCFPKDNERCEFSLSNQKNGKV